MKGYCQNCNQWAYLKKVDIEGIIVELCHACEHVDDDDYRDIEESEIAEMIEEGA